MLVRNNDKVLFYLCATYFASYQLTPKIPIFGVLIANLRLVSHHIKMAA